MNKECIRVTSVEVLHDYVIRLGFWDGTWRDVDMEPELYGPIFGPLHEDYERFKAVRVTHSTIEWPDEIDLCPDVLYGAAEAYGDTWDPDFKRTTTEPGSGGVEYLRKQPQAS